jgi:hypothetical protein
MATAARVQHQREALRDGHSRGAHAVICKRSEHGLGHLLNPLDPASDNRDWITDAWNQLIHHPEALLNGGGPPWLDHPALTRISITSQEVARAFAIYNNGRDWRAQIKPFNFILHAHIDPIGYPAGVDRAHFRLIAPYESDPARWLQLPWVDLYTGKQYEVTTDPNNHRADVVRLKTYRDVLALYQHHPEPKSLDANGNPCNRRSPPGLLSRRPITALTLNLIGKESNRLDETVAGLIGTLDDSLATYRSPNENEWTRLVVPALDDFSNRTLARLSGLNPRTLQRMKSGAIASPHERNRTVLTLITAQLATERLATWGITTSGGPLEQLARYIDEQATRSTAGCVICDGELTGRQRLYCSDRCRSAAYKARQIQSVKNTDSRRAKSIHDATPPLPDHRPATFGGIFPAAPS